MKKIIILSVSLLLATCIQAQKSTKTSEKAKDLVVMQERTTADYEQIDVSGSFDVELTSGTEGKISLKGKETALADVTIESNDGILKVYFKNEKASKYGKITVTIPVESINNVALTGSGTIQSKNIFKSPDFIVAVTGSGTVKIGVEATTLHANVTGSGNLKLNGNTNRLIGTVKGSGSFLASDLEVQTAIVEVFGSGNMEINVKEKLEADIKGSGKILYKGNPGKETTKVAGSGIISKQ